jgi:hypothetical protein
MRIWQTAVQLVGQATQIRDFGLHGLDGDGRRLRDAKCEEEGPLIESLCKMLIVQKKSSIKRL